LNPPSLHIPCSTVGKPDVISAEDKVDRLEACTALPPQVAAPDVQQREAAAGEPVAQPEAGVEGAAEPDAQREAAVEVAAEPDAQREAVAEVAAEPDAQREAAVEVAAEPDAQREAAAAAVVAEPDAQREAAAAVVEAPCVQQEAAVAAMQSRVRPPAASADFAAIVVGPRLEASCCLMVTTVLQILMPVVRPWIPATWFWAEAPAYPRALAAKEEAAVDLRPVAFR
jgi:hypothetical protein